MREYETIYITRPDLAEESRKKILDKATEIIGRGEGAVLEQEDWGVKRLSYRIGKCDKGHYVYLHYSQKAGLSTDLERMMRLEENVLKYMTVVYGPRAVPRPLGERGRFDGDGERGGRRRAPGRTRILRRNGEKPWLRENGPNGTARRRCSSGARSAASAPTAGWSSITRTCRR